MVHMHNDRLNPEPDKHQVLVETRKLLEAIYENAGHKITPKQTLWRKMQLALESSLLVESLGKIVETNNYGLRPKVFNLCKLHDRRSLPYCLAPRSEIWLPLILLDRHLPNVTHLPNLHWLKAAYHELDEVDHGPTIEPLRLGSGAVVLRLFHLPEAQTDVGIRFSAIFRPEAIPQLIDNFRQVSTHMFDEGSIDAIPTERRGTILLGKVVRFLTKRLEHKFRLDFPNGMEESPNVGMSPTQRMRMIDNLKNLKFAEGIRFEGHDQTIERGKTTKHLLRFSSLWPRSKRSPESMWANLLGQHATSLHFARAEFCVQVFLDPYGRLALKMSRDSSS